MPGAHAITDAIGAGGGAGWQTERVGEIEFETAFERAMDELAHSWRLRQREVAALRAAGCWPHGVAS